MLKNEDILIHTGKIIEYHSSKTMTLSKTKTGKLNSEEWEELLYFKKIINLNPASVHYEKMEKISDLMVRSLREQGG